MSDSAEKAGEKHEIKDELEIQSPASKKNCTSPSTNHSPVAPTNDEADSNISGYFDELEDEEANSSIQDEEDEIEVSTVLDNSDFEHETSRPSEDRKVMALLANFSEDQLNKFETFRRATFAKACVKRIMHSVLNTTVTQNVAIAMAGMTKVFVGELLDEAFAYRERLGDDTKLRPKHVREAARILQDQNKSSTSFRSNYLN